MQELLKTVKIRTSRRISKSEYVAQTGFVDLIKKRKNLSEKITLLSILLKKIYISGEENETSENKIAYKSCILKKLILV